jgi:hypothetical protein
MNSSQSTGSRPDHIAMSSELFDSYKKVTFGDVIPSADFISISAAFTAGLHHTNKDMHTQGMCTEECDRKETWVWEDKKQLQFLKASTNLADVVHM